MPSLRDGPPITGPDYRRSPSRIQLVITAISLLALFFVASGGALWHHDAPGSAATCPVCHAAHMPISMGAFAAALPIPSSVEWVAAPESSVVPAARTVLNAAPRAPPV